MDWASRINEYAPTIQAGAAIVALAIAVMAVMVPAGQQRRREAANEREQQLKARCLATAVRLGLHDVQVALSRAKVSATAQLAAPSPGAWPLLMTGFKVDVPSTLAGSLDQVYLLGDPAGPMLLRLNAILNNYNNLIDGETTLGITDPAVPMVNRWDRVLAFIEDVLPKVGQALVEVSAIADRK